MSSTPPASPEAAIGRRGAMMRETDQREERSVPPAAPAVAPPPGRWLLAATVETSAFPGIALPEGARPKPVGQIVEAIGFVRASISGRQGDERLAVVECRAGGRAGVAEKALIAGFWQSFDTWKPRLVSFNGRGHLIPVLRFASMRHGLTARWLHDAGDKWSGFGSRFSTEHHADVMDVLSDFNASPYSSLSEVASAISLPLPAAPAEDARIRAVENASTIFLAYVKWRLFTGAMTREGADEAAASMAAMTSMSSTPAEVPVAG